MIRSFAHKETERLWLLKRSRGLPPAIQDRALRKLSLLDAAERLDDLTPPPSNRLHALTGDREGQHSLSINKQWRICFIWKDGHADNVEIVDYH